MMKKVSEMNSHGVMDAVWEVWIEHKNRGGTMESLGIDMGYERTCARQAVSQFLKSQDPRIDTLFKFATATGHPITRFVGTD